MKKTIYPLLWLVFGIILTFAGVLTMLNLMDVSAISYTMGIAVSTRNNNRISLALN